MISAAPKLRFPEFKKPWKPTAVSSLIERKSDSVDVHLTRDYYQIGVRSHGRGVFHKPAVSGAELGNKRVFHVVPNALVVNIVFAWEQAVALTSDADVGFIASHRFPMFIEKSGKSYLPFLRQMFLTKRGKLLLEIASPGGAGRNKTLGQQEFLKLKPVVPTREEQKKIADTISAVDAKLAALSAKKAALERFKAGLMQKLFSQQLRFTREDGTAFPDWVDKRLGDVVKVFSGGTPSASVREYYSGEIPFIKSGEIAATQTAQFINPFGFKSSSAKIVEKGDILYALYGANSGEVAISKIAGAINQAVMCIRTKQVRGYIFQLLAFNRARICAAYLQGGQGNLSADIVKSLSFKLPDLDEQHKIAAVLTAMDAKIQAVGDQITKLQTFKKGLLQQMFV
jgi:type I restriction enzyme S subunit